MARPQAFQLAWPLTPSQLEGLNDMLQGVFRAQRVGFDPPSFANFPEHADNAAAVVAGLAVGTPYRTGDTVKVVH